MSYIVYILYFAQLGEYYVGHTADTSDRLFRHNNSGSRSTKKANDGQLKYTEQYQTRSEASARELQIKRKKSRKYIEWLINSSG